MLIHLLNLIGQVVTPVVIGSWVAGHIALASRTWRWREMLWCRIQVRLHLRRWRLSIVVEMLRHPHEPGKVGDHD